MFSKKMMCRMCACSSVFLVAQMGHASMTEAGTTIVENGIEGVYTVQVWVQFDNGADMIEAVYGNSEQALSFDLYGGSLVNFGDNGGASATDDDPGNGAFDSYIGFVGSNAAIAGVKTPDFWGVPNGGLLTGVLDDGIGGLSDDNSSYFVPGGLPVGALDNSNRVTIGQFSWVGGAGCFIMAGGVQYNNGTQATFEVQSHLGCPAPGALAVFGFAAIGRRRR